MLSIMTYDMSADINNSVMGYCDVQWLTRFVAVILRAIGSLLHRNASALLS